MSPSKSCETNYAWSCVDCLACHFTGSKESAISQARAHITDFEHRITTSKIVDGVQTSTGTVYGPGHPNLA